MTATIFALASGAGRGAVSVLRLSGPDATATLAALCAPAPLPPPRMAGLRALSGPAGPIDQALVIHFPGPASFTGEDVVEFHIHGGRATLQALSEALAARPGLRPAEPGEFSRRAFQNGKMDLTRAEAIADLVEAETAAQARQALRQMGGGLARLYEGWSARLARALAHLEAHIDFADGEDLPEDIVAESRAELAALRAELATHLADGHRGERLRDGLSVALLGAPNAGKSSLMNALARRDVAIVAETAGTTRDVIEAHLDLAGWPVTLADTAGLREGADPVEAEGIRRARARAEAADITLLLFDASAPPDAATLAQSDQRSLFLWSKADLVPECPPAIAGQPAMAISARTGAGLKDLLTRLAERAESLLAAPASAPLTRARHRAAATEAAAALARAATAPELELAAEDARLALRALGRITGQVDVEDLLDMIFRDFCIGK